MCAGVGVCTNATELCVCVCVYASACVCVYAFMTWSWEVRFWNRVNEPSRSQPVLLKRPTCVRGEHSTRGGGRSTLDPPRECVPRRFIYERSRFYLGPFDLETMQMQVVILGAGLCAQGAFRVVFVYNTTGAGTCTGTQHTTLDASW